MSNSSRSGDRISLRAVEQTELDVLFLHQQDERARIQAAFTSKNPGDRSAFLAHWNRILQDDTVEKRTIVVNDVVVGHIASWVQDEKRHITYWIDSAYWGKGIATSALATFIGDTDERPLYASAAKDNVASLRVLQKCGFRIIGEEIGFANAREKEVEEVILELPTTQ